MSERGPHDPDVPVAPRFDPERLDGLPPRAAGEGPGGVRPYRVEGEAARERRELLRPHGPDNPRDPVRPPGDGERNRYFYAYAYGYAGTDGEERRAGRRCVRDAPEGEAGRRELQRGDPSLAPKQGEPPGFFRCVG